MVNPKSVEYGRVKIKNIIYEEKDFAIADLSYGDSQVYGIRWSGSDDEKSKGTPTAFGKPTWFILPNKIVESFIKINMQGDNK